VRVWTYVIVNDAGVAPNSESPAATLAICKPRIRKGAVPRDMVLAFSGRRLSPEPHSVCWAGIIGEVLDFASYWNDKRFQGKKPSRSKTPDNIYRPTPSGVVQVKNPSHTAENQDSDLGGRHVLVFRRYWYFGASAPVLPYAYGLRMVGGRRGHRLRDIGEAASVRLIEWLNSRSKETRIPGRTLVLERGIGRATRCGHARSRSSPAGKSSKGRKKRLCPD
jgi:hypothetical protein